jgi:hypothetical protein
VYRMGLVLSLVLPFKPFVVVVDRIAIDAEGDLKTGVFPFLRASCLLLLSSLPDASAPLLELLCYRL